MASSKETYCLCGQPYNIGQFMIECDCCREWFHGSCVDVKIYQSDDIDKYHCPKCAQTYGPSVLKIPTNNHRADRYELGAESRAAQAGSPAWVRALAARPPRPLHNALQRMRGYQFTEEFVRDNGFSTPILFATTDGLEMKVPSATTFSARSVLRYCGAQLEVEVIDVRKQSTVRMPLGEFVDYFETPPETREEKVLNVISLEFSDTNMSPLVDPPLTARKLDWAERVWPATSRPPRPAVQKYCLMSAAGAYTDWHVDFGGTTVWYHVLRGGKIFYLAPPTSTNLALYQQWSASTNQNERFFGDMVEWYGTAELNAGETLVIPSGWLHAVLTPRDSLVLGGNLLHSYSIEMQLQVYEIERRVETPVMFRYPLFEPMHWYAGAFLLASLRRHNEESQDEDFTISEHDIQAPPAELPPLLLRGVKLLSNALKEWHALKSTDAAKRDNVPKCLNSGQLVRELCKELRTLEKRTSTASKDKDFKIRHQPSPAKHAKRPAQKKSLKLTLPKPIMHMAHNNGEYPEEKLYEKPYIDKQEIPYQDPRYLQEIKYHDNGLQEAKTFIIDGKELVLSDKNYMYQSYDEQLVYGQEANGFVEHDKKNGDSVLRIKMDSSPSSSREAPPPYTLPEHSILKSHLIGRPLPGERLPPAPPHKHLQQWTISKKDIEMQEGYQEEQILFTNENLQANVHAQDIAYGPGMYSAEDIAPYQYVGEAGVKAPPAVPSPAVPSPAAPAYPHYSYLLPRDTYTYEDQPTRQTAAAYSPAPAQHQPAGEFPHELPSYDAAIQHQHQYTTGDYVIEERLPLPPPRPSPPAPVRRSERPVRRRVSPTYDYEDGDLYIDEPAPRKPRQTKARRDQQRYTQPAVTTSSNYAPPAARPAPVNGIESLIQASVLAEEEPPTEPTETVVDSEDAAVAGMLSIGARYSPQRTFGLAARRPAPLRRHSTSGGSSKRQRKVTSASADEEELEEDVIKEVHRDEEYVYPSLEMSSDEDEEWTASRRRNSRHRNDAKSKNDKDGLWSPRARLGRLVPRLRSGRAAPRQSVRQALLHARHHDVKRDTHAQQETQNAKRAVIAAKSRRPPPAPTPPPTNANNTRLKKGMKTAKQRLGKILKIHKMIY